MFDVVQYTANLLEHFDFILRLYANAATAAVQYLYWEDDEVVRVITVK